MSNDKEIQLDLRQVLDTKLGAKSRMVPDWVVRRLEKMVCVEQLNEILRINQGKSGADFADGAMKYLQVEARIDNPEVLPPVSDRRVIFVCNHPLGGLDGIVLISLLSRLYGRDVRFVVNDMLMAVEPLQEVFLPINKHGKQSRESVEAINKVMEGDAPVLVFPAGLVSRAGKGGVVRDLDWHKMFVNKAVQYRRDVVPLFFTGENSKKFYRYARWRKRIGIKLNIEMVMLPKEMLRARGSQLSVKVGSRIPWQTLRSGKDAVAQAREIKEIVYNLDKDEPKNH